MYRKNKYNVAPKANRTTDGIVFDSKKELEKMVVEGALKAIKEYGNVFERLKRDDNTKL